MSRTTLAWFALGLLLGCAAQGFTFGVTVGAGLLLGLAYGDAIDAWFARLFVPPEPSRHSAGSTTRPTTAAPRSPPPPRPEGAR